MKKRKATSEKNGDASADVAREREEDLRRLELIEKRDELRAKQRDNSFLERVRNYDPARISRFRRIRVYSSLLTALAYFWIPVAIAIGGLATSVAAESAFGVAVGVLATILATILGFVAIKLAAEFAWWAGDIGDRLSDSRDLLIDVRDGIDRAEATKSRADDPSAKKRSKGA